MKDPDAIKADTGEDMAPARDTQSLPAPASAGGDSELGRMFSSLIELAKDPAVQPEKMAAIVQIQKDMLNDTREQAFRSAMAAARSEMPAITKEGRITNKHGEVQSRYAHFEAIDAIVRPIARKHGLDYGFDVRGDEKGTLTVSIEVTHVSEIGAWTKVYGPMPLAIDTTGAKNATQGAGSASSYGKRYVLCAAFNIITTNEDDDGNLGRKTPETGHNFAKILDEAQRAAARGSEAYAQFFGKLTNMQKGWLVDEGHHAHLKAASAAHD